MDRIDGIRGASSFAPGGYGVTVRAPIRNWELTLAKSAKVTNQHPASIVSFLGVDYVGKSDWLDHMNKRGQS